MIELRRRDEAIFPLYDSFLSCEDVFQYPLKTSENQRFSDVFRGYIKTLKDFEAKQNEIEIYWTQVILQ